LLLSLLLQLLVVSAGFTTVQLGCTFTCFCSFPTSVACCFSWFTTVLVQLGSLTCGLTLSPWAGIPTPVYSSNVLTPFSGLLVFTLVSFRWGIRSGL
jgi:hypothetical protein